MLLTSTCFVIKFIAWSYFIYQPKKKKKSENLEQVKIPSVLFFSSLHVLPRIIKFLKVFVEWSGKSVMLGTKFNSFRRSFPWKNTDYFCIWVSLTCSQISRIQKEANKQDPSAFSLTLNHCSHFISNTFD